MSFVPGSPKARLLMPSSRNRARLRSMFALLCASYSFVGVGLVAATLPLTAGTSGSSSSPLVPLLVSPPELLVAHSSLEVSAADVSSGEDDELPSGDELQLFLSAPLSVDPFATAIPNAHPLRAKIA